VRGYKAKSSRLKAEGLRAIIERRMGQGAEGRAQSAKGMEQSARGERRDAGYSIAEIRFLI